MIRNETIKKLTEGHDERFITWLSLEDWDELPSKTVIDDIANAWHDYGGDTAGFIRYVRHIRGLDKLTAEEIYEDLIQDPEERHRCVSFTLPYFETEYIQSLEDHYDVYGPVVYEAVRMVRSNSRKNL